MALWGLVMLFAPSGLKDTTFLAYLLLVLEKRIEIVSLWKANVEVLNLIAVKVALFGSRVFVSSVQFSCSVVSDSLRPHEIAACQASLSITNSRSPLRLTSIESVMPSSHLILCRPLLLPPVPPSIRVFSSESTLCMRWPKHWSFSFSIIPSKEIPGLISFRVDWLDLLAVQSNQIRLRSY